MKQRPTKTILGTREALRLIRGGKHFFLSPLILAGGRHACDKPERKLPASTLLECLVVC
jgi:hypothetical protein